MLPISFGHGTYELSIKKLANHGKDVFSLCHEALPLVSSEARSAEVPGKQFTQFPWAGGSIGRCIPSLGIRGGCLAVTVPRVSHTACRVLS